MRLTDTKAGWVFSDRFWGRDCFLVLRVQVMKSMEVEDSDMNMMWMTMMGGEGGAERRDDDYE